MRYIYGVGPTRSKKILEVTGIDPDRRTQDLNEQELSKISNYIIDEKIMVEGDLRRAVTNNLKRLQSIRCYRGLRHQRGLPVRGQRIRLQMQEPVRVEEKLLVLSKNHNFTIR